MENERVSFVCTRAGQIRKGKTTAELTQKEAFVLANKEWKQNNEAKQ